MNRKLFVLLALLAAAALVLTGCGGKKEDAQPTEAIELKTVAAGEEQTAATDETAAEYTIKLSTEGSGMYTYTDHEGDQFSGQNGFFKAVGGTEYVIEAVPEEGWKVVGWKLDGADFSSEAKITVTPTQDIELTAVFAEQ